MASPPTRADLLSALRGAVHPPLREVRFWVIQAMVLVIAGLHLLIDLDHSLALSTFPTGIPVALLIVPVGYAAMRYGLAGAAATSLWAILLWLPDLLIPNDRGHIGSDATDLVLVVTVAFAFGQRIEAERTAHARVERSTAQALAVEARYRRLFETNRSPILVLDRRDDVSDANPAAQSLLGVEVVGRPWSDVVGDAGDTVGGGGGRMLAMPDGRTYRLDTVCLPAGMGDGGTQVVLEDVTEERSEGRRATRYAQLVVQAEEDQRRRLARELHDEPLQLFLHLARRLELLGGGDGVPATVVAALGETRLQALDAASRLRSLARDLRPPSLDELGLVPALASLVADTEDEHGVDAALVVIGTDARLPADVELSGFRIVQESVRNALRHSGTDRVRVTVVFGAGHLTLTVADDGRGFDLDHVERDAGSTHLGLRGMGERARMLGGRLDIRSTRARGTVVEATLPLHGHGSVGPGPAWACTPFRGGLPHGPVS